MFENMVLEEKAWKEFCNWIGSKYGYEYNKTFVYFFMEMNRLTRYIIPDDIILLLIADFFHKYSDNENEIYQKNKALKESLELAFKKLNDNLEGISE